MFCNSSVVYLRARAQIPKHAASRTVVPMELPEVDRCSNDSPVKRAGRMSGRLEAGGERR